jgi:hypothetical protein
VVVVLKRELYTVSVQMEPKWRMVIVSVEDLLLFSLVILNLVEVEAEAVDVLLLGLKSLWRMEQKRILKIL